MNQIGAEEEGTLTDAFGEHEGKQNEHDDEQQRHLPPVPPLLAEPLLQHSRMRLPSRHAPRQNVPCNAAPISVER